MGSAVSMPDVEPVAWQPERDAGCVGPFARNERLSTMTLLPLDGEVGPETIAVPSVASTDGVHLRSVAYARRAPCATRVSAKTVGRRRSGDADSLPGQRRRVDRTAARFRGLLEAVTERQQFRLAECGAEE